MRRGDLFGDVETETKAGGVVVGVVSIVEPVKGIKELRYHVRRNGGALVVHKNLSRLAVAFGGYGHGRSDGAMLDGIADKIGYNLASLVFIPLVGQLIVAVHLKRALGKDGLDLLDSVLAVAAQASRGRIYDYP